MNKPKRRWRKNVNPENQNGTENMISERENKRVHDKENKKERKNRHTEMTTQIDKEIDRESIHEHKTC